MKRVQLFTIVFFHCLINLNAQIKKGPPDLSGNWVTKNDDGSILRHFLITQSGNTVAVRCIDADRKDLMYNFSWDVPGNYVLLGNITGIHFLQTNFSTTVGKYYGTSEAGRFNRNGKVYTIYDGDNINTVINYSLCETNSFTCDASFTISQTLDNILVKEKSVWIKAPEPYLESVLDVDGKTPVIVGSATSNPAYEVVARPSSSHCGILTYANNYDQTWNLIKVKDSW
ncbi:MAG: hypothetical protein JST23_01015 [Bacteroidetes bacterium]|nr:hypothetical protein [Bacteroidota bacterium]